ncbi:hypothetical protein BDN71DRAFT_1511158 [Pleurotus eryngii]|uniref:Uncharacterized protein n=1 Tax=Pleurotus eryngii TaxID=5323 RepID=A0A9P6DBD9_PLEER|nr:hypothetical protein BDN71DRAFT_1511158 [Pleurotus eryngii]
MALVPLPPHSHQPKSPLPLPVSTLSPHTQPQASSSCTTRNWLLPVQNAPATSSHSCTQSVPVSFCNLSKLPRLSQDSLTAPCLPIGAHLIAPPRSVLPLSENLATPVPSEAHIAASTPPASLNHLLLFVLPFQLLSEMGSYAKVEQSAPNCLPTMGEGDVDLTLLWDWFVKCENFLHHNNVSGLDMMKTVAFSMGGVRTIRWLAAKGLILSDMDWDIYKNQMCSLFLACDWKHTTHMDILRMCQPSSKPFMDFTLKVMGKNNLLAGMDSFMNNEYMRETLEAAMEQELSRECNHENTPQIVDFQEWLNMVKRLDKHRCSCLKKLAYEITKMLIRQSSSTCLPFQHPNTGSTASPSAITTHALTPIPRLLQTECDLLSANSGCYKCRCFWANHISACCTALPLDGATYKTLTVANVPPHPSSFSARGNLSCQAITAVLANNSQQSAEKLASTSRIENVDNNSDLNVAAILPNITSCMVDTTTPDFSDDKYAPFVASNIFWSCHLMTGSSLPTQNPPLISVNVNNLIDDGSSVVLIKQELVQWLGLWTFTVSSPFTCNSAFSTSSQQHSLKTFIKIHPCSLDGRFSSIPLHAFIAPSLVTDLILGLLFLQLNKLVLDHGLQSCTSKLDNGLLYDLLQPSSLITPSPLPKWRLSHVKASKIRAAQRLALSKVKDVIMGLEMALKLE